ncbi:MAG: molybdate ABC transporter permease subunit [Xanthomonadales bacterium]|nr:molybdate ABC transporter permease subunit [Xanthomonadales bacterium]
MESHASLLGPAEWAALGLSLKVALVATLASLPFAIVVAYWLAADKLPGRSLLDALVHLPLVMPPVVTGYLLLVLLGRRGLVGEWLEQHLGIVFAFRWTGAALAAAVMAFPLMVRAIRLAYENTDAGLRQAAASLGAPPVAVFLRVSVPLAWPGIVAGAVLAFAKALGEFGATITFVSSIPGQTQTLALSIYNQMQVPGGEHRLWPMVLLATGLSFAALFLSEALVRRSRQRLE